MSLYSKNYIKIYLWRFISILSGFLSLLIVVPYLSDNIEFYGIYAFCISLTLYLSYADIGFLNAGQKYAAEAYAKGDRKSEIEILGFTGAILLLMVVPFSIGMIYFSFNPDILIKDLSDEGLEIAGNIFLILGLVLPFQIIIQRLVQSILIIRIKDYISLRVDVIFNLIKIGSVFYFFTGSKYMIAEYYLFITIITIISSIVILIIIKKTEDYNFLELLKSIKLSKKQYLITKKLAYSSLFLTIGWVIYYELDLIIIGRWFGPQDVAVYAIGFTFLNFLRTLWNSVFSPFAQRFNHFVGLNSDKNLKELIEKIVDYTLPLCVIITLVLVLASNKITIYWVGDFYKRSIIIMQILILGTGFAFITRPASFYFTAKTKYTFIYLMAIILPLAFFVGLITLIPIYGIVGISISKSLAMFLGFVISMIGISQFYNPIKIIKKWFVNLLILCLLISFAFPLILDVFFISKEKSTINLVMLMLFSGVIIIASYASMLLTKKQQRDDIKNMWAKFTEKRNITSKND